MRWSAHRHRLTKSSDDTHAGDGLDTLNWELLRQSVTAAHQGDADAHVAALHRLEEEAPIDAKVGAYLWFLLRYRVADLLGRRPEERDLRELAMRFYPKFSKLIRGDQRQLEDTLLTVFEFAPEDRKVKGGRAVVMGSAALGVLLDNPEADLIAMRPHLAKWWQRNVDEFRDLGGVK